MKCSVLEPLTHANVVNILSISGTDNKKENKVTRHPPILAHLDIPEHRIVPSG